MAFAKHRTRPFAALLAALLIVVVQTKLFGGAFIAPPMLASRPARRSTSTGSTQEGADGFGMGSAIPVAGLLAVAAATSKCQAKRSTAPVAVPVTGASLTGASLITAEVEEPKVIMRGGKGRRWRLGLTGKTCMLTGRRKVKGYYRTYVGKKIKRWWRPNVQWRKVWWEEEKMWVSLYISAAALRLVDDDGLQAVATKAGLDLYSWVKPHWEAGSRQPLCSKVGCTVQASRDRKIWPQYEKHLNAGRPMADVMPGPHALQAPMPWTWRRTKLNPATHIFEPKKKDKKQKFDYGPREGKRMHQRLKVTLPGMVGYQQKVRTD